MKYFVCCVKSKESYNRIIKHTESSDFEWEEFITELEQVQEKLSFTEYSLAIIDEKLWWKDDVLELFSKFAIPCITFRGDFEELFNEINALKEEIERKAIEAEENKVEDLPKEPEVKYVYIEKPVSNKSKENIEVKAKEKIIEAEKIIKIETVVEVPKYVDKIVSVKPSDYKKIVGITGTKNTGRSFVLIQAAGLLSKNIKVAIADVTKNQNLSYYYKNEDDEDSQIEKIHKNLHLYRLKTNEDVLKNLDALKQQYDLVLVDFDYNEANISVERMMDNIFLVADTDPTHAKVLHSVAKSYIKGNIPPDKLKLLFNKVVMSKFARIIYELCRYEDEEFELPKLDCFSVDLITNEKVYPSVINFDYEAFEKDEVLKSQIQSICDCIYTVDTEKKGFFKRLFS